MPCHQCNARDGPKCTENGARIPQHLLRLIVVLTVHDKVPNYQAAGGNVVSMLSLCTQTCPGRLHSHVRLEPLKEELLLQYR